MVVPGLVVGGLASTGRQWIDWRSSTLLSQRIDLRSREKNSTTNSMYEWDWYEVSRGLESKEMAKSEGSGSILSSLASTIEAFTQGEPLDPRFHGYRDDDRPPQSNGNFGS